MRHALKGVRASAPLVLLILACLIFATGCDSERGGTLFSNRSPETFLSLYPDTGIPDTSLASTTSQQRLHWWGDDPDGYVIGFLFSWEEDEPNPNEWFFTTAYESTFALSIAGTDTTYTFRISSVDDAGDVDPTPAIQHFPVHNSAPNLEFVIGSAIPDTTYTVASFFWSGTDFDGDETIQAYYWTLDDSTRHLSEWHRIPATESMITLTADSGLVEGDHIFYLLAEDVAGAHSLLARMPDESRHWHVREPRGEFLIVDDYAVADNAPAFYSSVVSAFGEYSVWNIRADRNGDGRADLLPFSTLTLTKTLELFSTVIWYGDQGGHVEDAQVSVADYLDGGGRVIMSISLPEGFSNIGDPLDFVGVDSITTLIRIIPNGTVLHATEPDSLQLPQLGPLPDLTVESAVGALVFVWGLEPLPSAQVLYRLQPGGLWSGEPVLGVWHSSNRLAFLEFPLHQVNRDGRAAEMLTVLLEGLG